MRYLVAATAAACALVALATLPPWDAERLEGIVGTPGGRYQAAPPLEERRRLTRAVRRVQGQLQRVRWRDSLSARVLEHDSSPALLVVDPALDNGPAEDIARERLALEMDGKEGEAAIALALIHPETSAQPGAPPGLVRGTEYFFGEGEDRRPWCVTVHAAPSDGILVRRWQREGSLMGLCAWMGHYGLPGESVEAWIRGPGATLAVALEPVPWEDPGFQPLSFVEGPRTDLHRRGPLGLRETGGWTAYLGAERDRCFAGIPDGCLATVLEDPSLNHFVDPPPRRLPDAEVRYRLIRVEHHLMAELEAEFGPERFRSFWRSDDPVPHAFETAFGEPMDAWLSEWYGRWVEITPPGPAPGAVGLVGTWAMVLLGGLGASAALRRWSVTG